MRLKVKFREVYYVNGPQSDTDDGAYILVTPDGQEIPAVMVDELTVFDAKANDIRAGKTAATDDGITVGTKKIPTYHTYRGAKVFMPNTPITLTNLKADDVYDYTQLQTIICLYNTSVSNSVSAEMVSIDDSVYPARSVESVSAVNKNHDTKAIEFGITNTFGKPCVVRYFTYKEIE